MQKLDMRCNLKNYVERITTKSKGGLYVCPICGSGTGANGTGAFSLNGVELWKCFSCDRGGDIYDLYTELNGGDFKDAAEHLESIYGGGSAPDPERPGAKVTAEEAFNKPAEFNLSRDMPGHAALFLEDSAARAYLLSRGISAETAKRCGVGYHRNKRALVFPLSGNRAAYRAIDPESDRQKYNSRGGDYGLYNAGALRSTKGYCFLVEGQIDALSLEEIGHPAAAICSTYNYKKAAEIVNASGAKRVIVCMDADQSGREAAERLKALITIPATFANMELDFLGITDINDFHIKAPDSFRSWAAEWVYRAQEQKSTKSFLLSGQFSRAVSDFKKTTTIKTGFPDIDNNMGGLYAGLHVLAGVSGLGKSTFALQVADSVARSGAHVLYVSLEMSQLELVCKSFSRLRGKAAGVSSFTIRNGGHDISDIIPRYADEIGDRLEIMEGGVKHKLPEIENRVRAFTAEHSPALVILDYLQIVTPEGKSYSDKERIDTVIAALKNLSVSCNVPILALCSVNRDNYYRMLDFKSLKETGNIEYTCDTVLGLQYSIIRELGRSDENVKRIRVDQEAAISPRSLDFICLKNRYGRSHWHVPLLYYPLCDTFEERNTSGYHVFSGGAEGLKVV